MNIPAPAFGMAPLAASSHASVAFAGSRTRTYTQQEAHAALAAAGFDIVDTPPNAAEKTYCRTGLAGIGDDIRVSVPNLRSGTERMSKKDAYAVNLAVKEANRQDAEAAGVTPKAGRRTLAFA